MSGVPEESRAPLIDRRLGSALQAMLNDLKRDRTTAAAELDISEELLSQALNGEVAAGCEVRSRAIRRWPVSARDLHLREDDVAGDVLVWDTARSIESARILERAGRPYYEYRDTAMARVSPIRPEWIRMLIPTTACDPRGKALCWNRGHALHQLTFFLGDVDFYYERGGRRVGNRMRRGDSALIPSWVAHTFTAVEGGTYPVILAVTFPGRVTGDAIEDLTSAGGALQANDLPDTTSPSSLFAALLRARLADSSLTLERLCAEQVRQQIDRTIAEIEGNLGYLRASAQAFNSGIASRADGQIAARKEKLLRDRNLVAGLGFAMKPREGAGATYASSQVRKKIQQPTASTAPYTPEPVLSDAQYQNILEIMSNMVRVMELSPHAFSNMDEEGIRSHFLVQLNGQYHGQATGETFNYEGKTDILIKDKGRNIFIAECKFWRGDKGYSETIDQLLGYLSWRDTKAAILVFNRNKDFSSVLSKIKELTESHPNCKRLVRQISETSWEFRFTHRDDANREMTLSVMAFDIPKAT